LIVPLHLDRLQYADRSRPPLPLQVSKLDTDPASRDARPSAPAPSKLPHSKQTVYDPSCLPAWLVHFQNTKGSGWDLGAGADGGGGGGGGGKEGSEAAGATPAGNRNTAGQPGSGGWARGGSGGKRQQSIREWGITSHPSPNPAAGDDPPDPDHPSARRALFAGPGDRGPALLQPPSHQLLPDARPSSTPISALPPASQLDREVLDALPITMRLELERAYGRRLGSPPAGGAGGGAGPGGAKRSAVPAFFAGRPDGGGGAIADRQPQPAKRRKAEAPPAAAKGARWFAPRPAAQQPLTLSQIDPEVLAALPADVAQEVLRALPPAGGAALQRKAAAHAGKRQAAAAMAAAAQRRRGAQGVQQEDEGMQLAAQRPGLPLLFGRQHAPRPAFAPEPFADVVAAAQAAVLALMQSSAAAAPSTQERHLIEAQGDDPADKVAVLAEWLAQWLVGRDADLELVAKGLKFVRQLPAWVGEQQLQQQEGSEDEEEGERGEKGAAAALLRHLSERCAAVEAAVQRHIEGKMGFALRC
jgi:hypothetical protein